MHNLQDNSNSINNSYHASQTDKKLEKERGTIRIRGKNLNKWPRESAKTARNRARNTEIATKQDFEKEKEREKAQTRCKAERLKCQHKQQQQQQII